MGVSNLTIHTGLTKQYRIQADAPTSPAPESGDVYIDSDTGVEAIGIFVTSAWVYISLQV